MIGYAFRWLFINLLGFPQCFPRSVHFCSTLQQNLFLLYDYIKPYHTLRKRALHFTFFSSLLFKYKILYIVLEMFFIGFAGGERGKAKPEVFQMNVEERMHSPYSKEFIIACLKTSLLEWQYFDIKFKRFLYQFSAWYQYSVIRLCRHVASTRYLKKRLTKCTCSN